MNFMPPKKWPYPPAEIGSESQSLLQLVLSCIGSSIFELLPNTFYNIEKSNITGINLWILLLRKHNLLEFVQNSQLQKMTQQKESSKWFYLGSVQ